MDAVTYDNMAVYAYAIYHARSAFDKEGYKKIATVQQATEFTVSQIDDKYSHYYKVVAKNNKKH